ncbi:DNA-3-methyladenine glycosylase [Mangrovibacterium lignilyticum]|uniref:DNA-3-methyladenine glycosylase n=1 Tax=Mangrovibacterium lignilyticum TaxID=2668052 RepID=UPI0013D63682|nr:DNA-3-methyladenine glycosylase [Mangrovibacterium lignilyticum]
MTAKRLDYSFFKSDSPSVACELLGKVLVRRFPDGSEKRYRITEAEAYWGTDDLACHASKGRTERTEVIFGPGGTVYVYLIYGQYWLLNFVTGEPGDASAVLIRGIEGFSGPGRVGRELQLDRSFYGEKLNVSERLWVEDAPAVTHYTAGPRIGIHYAGEPWMSKAWRFCWESGDDR